MHERMLKELRSVDSVGMLAVLKSLVGSNKESSLGVGNHSLRGPGGGGACRGTSELEACCADLSFE